MQTEKAGLLKKYINTVEMTYAVWSLTNNWVYQHR